MGQFLLEPESQTVFLVRKGSAQTEDPDLALHRPSKTGALEPGIPYISLADFPPQKQALRAIPGTLARRHRVLPLKLWDSTLLLAMVDPLDVLAIDEVRLASRCEVRPVQAAEEEILAEIRQHYGALEKAASEAQRLSQEPVLDYPDGSSAAVLERPAVVSIADSLLEQAVEARASDIHIEPEGEGGRVRFRVDGVLHAVIDLPTDLFGPLVSRLKVLAGLDIAERRVPQDGRLALVCSGHEIDIRVSSLPTIRGEKLVLRLLDKTARISSLEELGFSPRALEHFRRLLARPAGMVLLTGPTGCGKTTTLYAALSALNSPDQNIVTIEDPVEYQIPGVNQVQVNPKAGIDFATGLRAILRQDPNIIMVGEIRDPETADTAIRAALTGRLVFSTLHTGDAPGAVTRLLEMGVAPYLLCSALTAVVAQRLVRCICPHCRESYQPTEEEWKFLQPGPDTPPQPLPRGRGCPQCRYTGYLGRVAILEIMEMTPALKNLVLNRRSTAEVRVLALRQGMYPLGEDGKAKVLAGQTTTREVWRVALG